MPSETTLVLLKPDAVARGLVPVLLERLQAKGLRFCRLELLSATRPQAEEHYEELRARGGDIFERNVDFLLSSPLVAVVLEGGDAVKVVRQLIGPTEPVQAPAGTIRGDFSTDSIAAATAEKRGLHNVIHASDSPAAARRETAVWFPRLR